MRVEPMTKPYKGSNYTPRAIIQIRPYDLHRVTDTVTRETFDLPPVKAWEKHAELNCIPRTESEILIDSAQFEESMYIAFVAVVAFFATVLFLMYEGIL